MRKLQILFPEPQLNRLREIASKQDRPVSEIVRESVQIFLSRYPESGTTGVKKPPAFHLGSVKVSATKLRNLAYSDRNP